MTFESVFSNGIGRAPTECDKLLVALPDLIERRHERGRLYRVSCLWAKQRHLPGGVVISV